MNTEIRGFNFEMQQVISLLSTTKSINQFDNGFVHFSTFLQRKAKMGLGQNKTIEDIMFVFFLCFLTIFHHFLTLYTKQLVISGGDNCQYQ